MRGLNMWPRGHINQHGGFMATKAKEPAKAAPKPKGRKKADPTPLGGRGGLACTVGREALAKAVGWAKGAVAARTTKDVLRLVRVEGHPDNTLTVRATDLSTTATLTLMGEVRTPGAFLLDPNRLTTILENADPDQCELDCGPEGAELRCGGRFEFPASEQGDDLPGPTAPEGKSVKGIDVPDAADLLLAFRSVRWACAGDEKGGQAKPVMKGVWWGAGDGGRLALMASDARYAGYCPVTGADCPAGVEAVVPPGPLGLFLQAAAGPVRVLLGRTLVAFRADTVEVVTSQLSGEYPSAMVSRAVTVPAAGWAEVESDRLYRAVRSAAAGLDRDQGAVVVEAGSDGSLVVRAGVGGAVVVVPAKAVEGEFGVVRLDPDRLLKAERVADTGLVRVEVLSAPLVRVVPAGGAVLAFAQIGEAAG